MPSSGTLLASWYGYFGSSTDKTAHVVIAIRDQGKGMSFMFLFYLFILFFIYFLTIYIYRYIQLSLSPLYDASSWFYISFFFSSFFFTNVCTWQGRVDYPAVYYSSLLRLFCESVWERDMKYCIDMRESNSVFYTICFYSIYLVCIYMYVH